MGKNYLYYHDFFGDSEQHIHGVEKVLVEKRTPYQFVQLVRSPTFGKMLIIDGDIQSTECDEYIYHEAMVHPPLILLDSPRKVVILGGGEGATLREVLRHRSVLKVFMVDIDAEEIEISKKYLSEWHQGSFDNPKATILNMEARKFIETQLSSQSVDVIISDLTEPFEGGSSNRLFTKEFFETIYDRLTEYGVFAVQASLLRITDFSMHGAIRNTLLTIFPIVRSYLTYIPSFDTTWGFVIASKKKDPINLGRQEIDELIASRVSGALRFYEGDTHIAMFSLPKDIKEALKKTTEIITDAHPILLKRKEDR